ncbi:sugar ABC transporter substrate-binding protein, partial [Microbispora bryophytorum]
MRPGSSGRRAAGMGAAILAAATGLAACSSPSGGSDGAGVASAGASQAAGGGTYTIWDPYPQFDDSSDWVKLLTQCGTEAGVTV